MVLADQGADIIKIEPPMIGDLARFMGDTRNGMGSLFSTLNRNKRSLVLDLKNSEDMAIFKKLVPTADVLIENYRPGIVNKLGIDYESLREINPGLVYTSISGYGQSGPYMSRRVYDPLIQATTGAAADQGGERPTNMRTIIFDKVTGQTAAQAVTAALLQREKTGMGQYLPISMLKSALYYQWPDAMWSHTFRGEDVTKSGELADYFQVFKTADGHVSIIMVTDDAFLHTCQLLGSELHLDPRFSSLPARVVNRDALQMEMDAAMSEWTSEEVCAGLDRGDVPVARVNTPEQVFDDPQVIEQGAILEVEHPVAGAMRIADTPFQFLEQATLPVRHAPTLGQHSAEVLQELGCEQHQIDRLEERERKNREQMAAFTLAQAGK